MARGKSASRELSLREKKSARLKLTILDSAVELIGKREFKDLHIEEICERAEISAVTLYKYFPQKEDILLYYFRIWCLHRSVEQEVNNINGILAVEHLFEAASAALEELPGLMYGLFGVMAELPGLPDHVEPNYAEKQILYPDHPTVADRPVPDLAMLFRKHLTQAIEKGDMSDQIEPVEVMKILQGIFYGGAITARSLKLPVWDVYDAHLQVIFDYFRS